MVWFGNRAWQAAVILLLTIMISLNLRILLTVNYSEEDMLDNGPANDPQCRGFLKYVGSARVQAINNTDLMLDWSNYSPSQARVLGHHRNKKSFLTIGVPSIKRVNGFSYLKQTIESIIAQTSSKDKTDVVVVIFLADFDTKYNEHVVQELVSNFMEFINVGFIQVVQASHDFYPPLTQLKRNFNDKTERVKWRAKQVSDFAFMFLYSQNISTYYIQLEDDVVCAPNFVWSIRDYIKHRSKSWAVLEFSELGFIGKLFKSADMVKLAKFMMTFYDEQPIDWLIRYYRMAMVQHKVYLRKPTLFQHIGSTSSFDTSKPNELKDRYFDSGSKQWKSDYPQATVECDMKAFSDNGPELAYSAGSGFFWSVSPRKGQSLTLTFDSDELLNRVVIETGNTKHPLDILSSAVLEASPASNDTTCKTYIELGRLEQGRLDSSHVSELLHGQPTKCLRLRVLEDQQKWAVIEQIAVFVTKPSVTPDN